MTTALPASGHQGVPTSTAEPGSPPTGDAESHGPQPSYDSRGSDVPLIGVTIDRCLEQVAALYPNNEAVISRQQNLRFNYRELDRIVSRAAKALLRLGIEKGDRVAIWSTNNYEWLTAQYATARIGAILVNVNPAYRIHELEFVLRASRAKMLMLVEEFESSNYVDMLYEVCPEVRDSSPGHIQSWRFPHLRSVVFIGSKQLPGMYTRRSFVELGDEMPEADLQSRRAALDIDDDINIQYTSGTTGFPKGVTLTHGNILNNGYFVACAMRLTPSDRLCAPVPFFHSFGMVGNLAAMTCGSTVVIPAPAFDATATLETVQEERCTALHGVPAMFVAELRHPYFSSYDLASLRTGFMAGAPCPVDVMRDVVEKMHMAEILTAYGQTESSPVVTMTGPNDPIERRAGTVGRVMPHQELKIVDPLTGRTVSRGQTGELCFRGYQVMRCYDEDATATAEAIDGHGWLHSGDLGTMDDDGYVKLGGRIQEMVVRGGERLHPREIEEFLRTLPEVYDVAVVGVPDDKYGEELLAWVKMKPGVPALTAEQWRERCKGRIAHGKIPRYWAAVDEFPMTPSGQVQKYRIRQKAIQDLGLEAASRIETA